MTQFCLANNRNIHTLCYNQKMIYTKWTWPNSALTITWNVRLSYWSRNILHLLCKKVKCRLIHKQKYTYISWCCREMIQTTFEEITQPLSPGSLLQYLVYVNWESTREFYHHYVVVGCHCWMNTGLHSYKNTVLKWKK